MRKAREQAGHDAAAKTAAVLNIPYDTYLGYENGNGAFGDVDAVKFAEASHHHRMVDGSR